MKLFKIWKTEHQWTHMVITCNCDSELQFCALSPAISFLRFFSLLFCLCSLPEASQKVHFIPLPALSTCSSARHQRASHCGTKPGYFETYNQSLSHELGSEQTNERSGTSQQCGASEWVSGPGEQAAQYIRPNSWLFWTTAFCDAMWCHCDVIVVPRLEALIN